MMIYLKRFLMSTSKDISGSDKNNSDKILAFPAGRRNVEWYNSRILAENNFRRSFQSAIPSPAGNGTIILEYDRPSSAYSKLNSIAFLIQGYYFYLKDEDECQTLKAINDKIGVPNGECWAYIYQDKVEGTSAVENRFTDFFEFACRDENNKFLGLFSGNKPDDDALSIPIVVPDSDGNGDINPAIDATDKGDYYKPWFQSSATWAAGEFSDKNKIWVDEVYDVPHICVKVGDNMKWIPLGAVYKTSRNSRV